MKSTKAEADISVNFRSASDAEAIVRALVPEAKSKTGYRAYAKVTRLGKTARMTFHAQDLVALRATVNSYLRLAATWRRVCDILRLEQQFMRSPGTLKPS